jgi:hypothetical protein
MVFYKDGDEVRKTLEAAGFSVVKATRSESTENTHGFPITLIWVNCLAQRV